MKRRLLTFLCFGIAAGIIGIVAATWRSQPRSAVESENKTTAAPSRMLRMGPVVDGMVSSKTMGDVTVKMEASRVWMKKTKLFGFDNGLLKKMVANDFCLTILKDGGKRIVISKDQVEMSPDQNIIEIDHPRIDFPADMAPPDSIRLDNQEMTLAISNGDSETIWDLNEL